MVDKLEYKLIKRWLYLYIKPLVLHNAGKKQRNIRSCYGLKHDCEQMVGFYIDVDDFISAAIGVNIPIYDHKYMYLSQNAYHILDILNLDKNINKIDNCAGSIIIKDLNLWQNDLLLSHNVIYIILRTQSSYSHKQSVQNWRNKLRLDY
jgi:hypothetical protein